MNYPKFDLTQYFQIKRRIDLCDVFYASLYNLTTIEYSNSIQTACINFDKDGNALNMQINYDFWSQLNEEAKTFVIMHELSHIIYDHGKRIQELDLDLNISNIASDIVINHFLCEKMGLIREMFDWKKYCWIETCFEEEIKNGEIIPTNKNFEFYYQKLLKQTNLKNKQLLGNHSLKEDKSNNDENNENAINDDKSIEKSNNDELNKISEILKEIIPGGTEIADFEFSDEITEIIKNNPEIINEEIKDKIKNVDSTFFENNGITPIYGSKESDRFEAISDFAKATNFEILLDILIPKKAKIDTKDEETWVGQHRRYMSFLKKNNKILLPNILEIEKKQKNKKKEVWVFMDTSGSCRGMFPFFGNIVKSLLKNKEINCRGFSFDDRCTEIDIQKNVRATFGNNGGGFDCVEEKILELMNKEKINYPDNVLVLSDGHVHFYLKDKLKKPENWILLLNVNQNQKLTPKGGRFFHLDDDFFNKKISTKSTNKKFKT